MTAAEKAAAWERLDQLDAEELTAVAALTEIARERAALSARLRALDHVADAPALDFTDLLKPKAAQREFGLSKSSLQRLGGKNPEGICFIDERGRRRYSKSRLRSYLDRNPPRKRTRK
ncbi:hypothetical protein [Bradyrhizobium sp. USDA 4471]